MNRPFYAFGTLLMLLALAMLAVSSASRSTTVAATHGNLPRFQTPPRGAVYVLVLPAAEEEAAQDALAAERRSAAAENPSDHEALAAGSCDAVESCSTEWQQQPTYATGCGLDRLTGVVYGCEPCWACGQDYCNLRRTTMTPARIKVAQGPGPMPAAVDYRSHYDPQYDRIVYGGHPRGSDRGPARMPIVLWSEVEGAELLLLFQGLVGPQQRPSKVTASGARPSWNVPKFPTDAWTSNVREAVNRGGLDGHYRRLHNLRTMYLGLRNYITAQLAARGWLPPEFAAAHAPGAPLGWADYAVLLDSRLVAPPTPLAAGQRLQETQSATPPVADVRSGRWLLHSAASMLNQAGTWLQEAAIELEQAGTRLEARHPGNLSR